MDKIQANEAVASVLRSGDRDALAEFLVEYIQPTHVTNVLVSMLLNTRALKPGDALVKKVRKGIEVRTLVPGAVHLASEVTVSERMNYILDGVDVKVTFDEWDIENGNIGTVADIRKEMLMKMQDVYVNKVFTALTTVWTAVNTPSNYTAVGGAITAAALENAINQINNTVGRAKAIVGVRSALTPITKFGAFWHDSTNSWTGAVDSQLEEVMRTGWLGHYYGTPIIALDQMYDNPEDYTALLPTDKILVIGENVGDFITYGEAKWKQWSDMNPTPPRWYLETWQQMGLIIDNAQGIYVLAVS